MESRSTDSFGFFLDDFSLKVGPYVIEPVKNHAAVVAKILELKHPDGFFYPIQSTKRKDSSTGRYKKIPNSEKPAHLFSLPATHSIYKKHTQELTKDFRFKDGAVIIRCLAFLYDCRAQFHDWKYDMRLPLKQDGIAIFNHSEIERLLNDVYSVFSTWDVEIQNHYNNILYLHSRCPAYEWPWEQFIMEYMVTDSLWKLFTKIYPCPKPSARINHSKRIETLSDEFDVIYDKYEVEKRIVELRNNLFHEGFWGGATPGFPQKNNEPFYANLNLRKINHRLILAITGLRSVFTKSDWRTFDEHSLY